MFKDFMRESFPSAGPLQVTSVAQGATNSLWSSIMMDSLLPEAGVDVLVWEYG